MEREIWDDFDHLSFYSDLPKQWELVGRFWGVSVLFDPVVSSIYIHLCRYAWKGREEGAILSCSCSSVAWKFTDRNV